MKIGDQQKVMDCVSILAKIETIEDIQYELYNGKELKDKFGIVRIFDKDSGEVVSIKKYRDYDNAEKKFDKAISILKWKNTY